MRKHSLRGFTALLLLFVLALTLSACSAVQTDDAPQETPSAAAEPIATASPTAASGYRPVFSDADLDASWSPQHATIITFTGDSAEVKGEGAAAVEGGVKISQAGTYVLSGTLNDGRVVVSFDSDELVKLVLNGVNLTSTTSAPLYVANGNVALVLADGTQNVLTDAAQYQFANSEIQEPNACLYADDNLSILGAGALTVNANFNNGIGSKDELRIASGSFYINAANNAIKGNDCVLLRDAHIEIQSLGDGIKSDNEKDAGMGVIDIEASTVVIVCTDDALQATNRVSIASGQVTTKAAGKRINCDGELAIAAGCLE